MLIHRILLVAGDLIAFLLFGALGRASHGLGLSIGSAAGAALPFALAWVGMGILLGSYDPPRWVRPMDAVKRAALTWLAAWPVGLAVRALILGRGAPWSFALVVFATNLLILTLWRGAYAWSRARFGAGPVAAAKERPGSEAKPL